jgi:hypothetical protein
LVALYVAVITFTAGNTAGGSNALPGLNDPGSVRAVYGVPFEIGYLMPLVLGVMMICGEYRHRTITPTFLVTPRRGRVLVAKVAVAGLVGTVIGAIYSIEAAVLGAALIAARGYPVLLTSHGVPRILVLMAFGLGVWCIVGLGFGALLQNQIAAIVTALVLTTIVEGLLGLLLGWVGLDAVAQYLPSRAASAVLEPANTGHTELLAWWAGALVLLAWGVGLAALGSLLTLRRDVT